MEQLGIGSIETVFEPVFFYAGDNQFHCFSNFYRSNIEVDGKNWPSVEHYFQAMKATSEPDQEAIRQAASPGLAKRMARDLTVDLNHWESVRYEVMLKALRVKFLDPELQNILLSTDERPIYEDSPTDRVWGTGTLKGTGPGRNLLGQALMQVRQEIKNGSVREKAS